MTQGRGRTVAASSHTIGTTTSFAGMVDMNWRLATLIKSAAITETYFKGVVKLNKIKSSELHSWIASTITAGNLK